MSTDRDVTRVVRTWLRTDEQASADRVLGTVLDALDTTPQRRSSPWPAWRSTNMSTFAKLGLAAAAVTVAVLLGLSYFGGRGVGDPGDDDATPLPSESAPPEATTLDAGTYTSTSFEPQITFTVPDGWAVSEDTPSSFRLSPVGLPEGVDGELSVCRGAVTAVDNSNTPIPGVGDSPQEILEEVASRTDIEVIQEPTPWDNTASGLPASWMEIWNAGDTELAILGPTCGNNLYPNARNRFAVLQLPDGSRITMTIFNFHSTADFLEAATPIAESIEFDRP